MRPSPATKKTRAITTTTTLTSSSTSSTATTKPLSSPNAKQQHQQQQQQQHQRYYDHQMLQKPQIQTLTLNPKMARKSSLLKQTLIATTFSLLLIYAVFNAFFAPSTTTTSGGVDSESSNFLSLLSSMQASQQKVKVFMYDLPRRFTYGIIEQHSMARGGLRAPVDDVTTLRYPGHQHRGEWYLFSDLNRPESERVGSPIIKVTNPEEADLFYVPVFSSLSLVVRVGSPGPGASEYSDEEMQESLVDWLEEQEYWRRNNGFDHVIIAGDPNAMIRVVDRIKNAVLLVSDFGRLRPDQGSLVKDVIIPYSHRISMYSGGPGLQDRNTLLFFMGNRYRKEVVLCIVRCLIVLCLIMCPLACSSWPFCV